MGKVIDVSTAMERLARELMGAVVSCAPTVWCGEHGIGIHGTRPEQDREHARADIERRIADARADDSGVHPWTMYEMAGLREKSAGLDALCRVLNAESADEAVAVARALAEEHCELKELREAGRVMPEGLSWPRYADGEPVLIGDTLRGRGREQGECKAIGVCACGRMTVVGEDLEDDENLVLLDPDLMERAPKAVGADGREVKVGDTVWLAREHLDKADMSPSDSGFECGLLGVGALDPLSVKSVGKKLDKDGFAFFTEHVAWCPASWLTHERPDSWGRLREDVRKDYTAYWGCIGFCCDKCPALVDGKKPNERYDTAGCHTAEQIDLLARAERLAGVQGE